MESVGKQRLIDVNGRLLDVRVQDVLHRLRPRFRRRLPRLDDDVLVTEIFEEAGRRIAAHEGGCGQANNLEAFAWTTLLNVARSRLGRSSMRLTSATLGGAASEAVLRTLQARDGTPEQIETEILEHELAARLTPEERDVYFSKGWGWSSREIARALGTSDGNVNTIYYRARQKIRDLLQSTATERPGVPTPQPPKPRTV